MTDQNNAAQAADQDPLSDEYVNALTGQHGYGHPAAVAARLWQWIGLHGGENSVTLLMYEAHKALSNLRAEGESPRRTETRGMANLRHLAAALGHRDWKWWDSCSFRRLTFEDGRYRNDGSALHGTIQPSDGHPDVNMAPDVREFIEAASPLAVGALCGELAAKGHDLANMGAALTSLIAECVRADEQAAGEVQRTFIYPNVLEGARRALAGHKVEGEAC
ncbi:hypothetical protein D3C71_1601530 [compost metagenome]